MEGGACWAVAWGSWVQAIRERVMIDAIMNFMMVIFYHGFSRLHGFSLGLIGWTEGRCSCRRRLDMICCMRWIFRKPGLGVIAALWRIGGVSVGWPGRGLGSDAVMFDSGFSRMDFLDVDFWGGIS